MKFIRLLGERPALRPMTNEKTGGPCLLVLLQSSPVLAKNLRWPLNGFTWQNQRYREAGFGNWTGFYDWLRDREKKIIGVQYTPFEETEFLAELASQLPYIDIVHPCHIRLYFSEHREFDAQLSNNQDFLYDAVFRSEEGGYALGFAIDYLSESELRSIENAQTHWDFFQALE